MTEYPVQQAAVPDLPAKPREDRLQRRVERERSARKQAEQLLEDKSRALYAANAALAALASRLETRVDERTAELRTVNNTLRGTLDQLQTAQDHLIQSEKLAALGALVAGVAHELNTRTVASSMLDSCRAMEAAQRAGLTRAAFERFVGDMQEGAELVGRNLDKAAELVSSFKQVAMDRTSAQRREFALAELLHEVRLTLSPTFKRTPYVIEIEVPAELRLDSYPGPLGQVITNLLENARIHAFKGRDHGLCRIVVSGDERGIDLIVSDDGCGIASANLSRIFDPFFTTMRGEGGNGLGMHIVHNIVTGILGGTIKVTSTVDAGAVFALWLPRCAPQPSAADKAKPMIPAAASA